MKRIVVSRHIFLLCLWSCMNMCTKFRVSMISGSWISRTPVFQDIPVRYIYTWRRFILYQDALGLYQDALYHIRTLYIILGRFRIILGRFRIILGRFRILSYYTIPRVMLNYLKVYLICGIIKYIPSRRSRVV